MTYEITHQEISETSAISSSSHADYIFVSAVFGIDINGYSTELQTGHDYYNDDYSLPSNKLSLYEADEVLSVIYEYTRDELESDNAISAINETLERKMSKSEILDISDSIDSAIKVCQEIVYTAEREAENKIEDDESFYLLITPREMYDYEAETIRVCGDDYVRVFTSDSERDDYIDEWKSNDNNHDLVQKIDAFTARGYEHSY